MTIEEALKTRIDAVKPTSTTETIWKARLEDVLNQMVKQGLSDALAKDYLIRPMLVGIHHGIIAHQVSKVRELARIYLAQMVHSWEEGKMNPYALGVAKRVLQKPGSRTTTLLSHAFHLHTLIRAAHINPFSGTPVEVVTKPDHSKLPQKIRALVMGRDHVKNRGLFPMLTQGLQYLDFAHFTPEEKVTVAVVSKRMGNQGMSGGDVFIRPCPETPNHGQKVAGFESFKSTNAAAPSKAVEILGQLPEGSGLMIMPHVVAQASAVMTPGMITLGPRHNGVTAGGEHNLNVTLGGQVYSGTFSNIVKGAGEKPDETEIELVHNKNVTSLVQFRRAPSGIKVGALPRPDAVHGFVPQGRVDRVDKHVIVRNLDDLEGIDEMFKNIDKSFVVFQPTGGIQSHASTTSRVLGIPFVNAEPDAFLGKPLSDLGNGWVVASDDVTPVTYNIEDYQEPFWEGIEYARSYPASYTDLGKLSLFFHQFVAAPLNNPNTLAYLSGVFVGWLAAAATAACLGEMRHIPRCVTEWNGLNKDVLLAHIKRIDDKFSYGGDRQSVYNHFIKYRHNYTTMAHLMKILHGGYTIPTWNRSYGGPKWGKCSLLGSELSAAIAVKDMKQAVGVANDLENAVHNGGNLFNKFIHTHYLDLGTQGVQQAGQIHYLFEAYTTALDVLKQVGKVVPAKAPHVDFDEEKVAGEMKEMMEQMKIRATVLKIVANNSSPKTDVELPNTPTAKVVLSNV